MLASRSRLWTVFAYMLLWMMMMVMVMMLIFMQLS